MRSTFILTLLVSALLLPATAHCESARRPTVEVAQQRYFETSRESAVLSVVNALQDLGYQLESADPSSGFVSGTSPNRDKTKFLDFLAGETASGDTRITAFVEELPAGLTRVRLALLNRKTVSGHWGTSRRDRPVREASFYEPLWQRIASGVSRRDAVRAAGSPASSLEESSGSRF